MRIGRPIWILAIALPLGCGRPPAGAPGIPVGSSPLLLDDGWQVAPPAAVGLEARALERIDSLRTAGKLGVLNSVVIVKDDKLVFERYYPTYRTGPPPIAETLDGMVPDRPFPPLPTGTLTAANVPPHTIQSCSKGITALVVGAAVDRGLLRLDQPVSTLLPRYADLLRADPRKARMTLEHVLTMTTGLDWKEAAIPYQDPRNLARRLNNSDDWAGFTLSQPMSDEPGARFEYCSGCTLVLSAILQQVTGKHTDQFAEEALFRPLGIDDFVWIRHARSKDSLAHTGGGLWLRPRDFAKLGYLHLSGGVWNGRRVLSPEWIRAAGTKHIGRQTYGSPQTYGYGYQWIVRDVPGLSASGPEDLVYVHGAAGQFVFAVKPLRMVVVVNGYNWDLEGLANASYGLTVLRTAIEAATRRETTGS